MTSGDTRHCDKLNNTALTKLAERGTVATHRAIRGKERTKAKQPTGCFRPARGQNNVFAARTVSRLSSSRAGRVARCGRPSLIVLPLHERLTGVLPLHDRLTGVLAID